MKWILLIFTVINLTACSGLGVKPWQRDLLAKPEMSLRENSMAIGFDDHTYFSKEGSSGGGSFAGGGCGCN